MQHSFLCNPQCHSSQSPDVPYLSILSMKIGTFAFASMLLRSSNCSFNPSTLFSLIATVPSPLSQNHRITQVGRDSQKPSQSSYGNRPQRLASRTLLHPSESCSTLPPIYPLGFWLHGDANRISINNSHPTSAFPLRHCSQQVLTEILKELLPYCLQKLPKEPPNKWDSLQQLL